ncbi:MAG: flagellar basal body P-ring protein FlgI [Nitrospinaceae bacterium]|nr:flagellar basal body P-ring protein FlgI [Nitrospinaceae bacterium]NIR53406.1 flagellar basal body P-ring protein FlgI [Nitrospinaceae bacterium]NIS83810.1 flagellar basal body P-ring protein FlgI [Nitrospinaceae bacterium]NIT80606.1 flagellar basal body P-ring protein FlgI [Nitrospinaceae bacterium]NIU42930.1 flagellar basal body P-ring protein FlgI [Nitrospinaceae bacterium]
MRKAWTGSIVAALLVVWVGTSSVDAARVKDLVNISGVRANKLIGFGLVIGLANTGDRATNVFFSIQTMVNMLQKLGVTVPENRVNQLQFKNVATVMVTAELPAFARQGDRIDVVVSSMGDSRSLQGGTLLMTPLKGADSITYAIAQGPVSIGGFAVQGQARGIQKNHPNVGRVTGGALVEKELPEFFNAKSEISLSLKTTDFTTGARIAKAINFKMKDVFAEAIDGRTIRVKVPEFYKNNVPGFVTKIETLEVNPDTLAKVIIDERTGTVVMGENVRISTVAVAHGNLFVQIQEAPEVSQPAPLSRRGQTVVVPRTDVEVEEEENRLMVVPRGVGIGEVVNALNAIGVTPRDLIAILQAIKASGSLHAELEII